MFHVEGSDASVLNDMSNFGSAGRRDEHHKATRLLALMAHRHEARTLHQRNVEGTAATAGDGKVTLKHLSVVK